MTDRKYSLQEIDDMRQALNELMGSWQFSGDGSWAGRMPKAEEVEQRLRTYMQNGTEPAELAEAAAALIREGVESAKAREDALRAHREANPPPEPRKLVTVEDVIDEWFQTSVARYAGASATAEDLYDGFSGHTLKRFANRHAPDGVHVRQRDMERYLDRKGIKTRNAMFAKRYDGIQVVTFGNVRTGNYGT